MKPVALTTSILAGGLCLAIVVAAFADEPARRTTRRDRSQAGQLDDKTTGAMIRASQLTGMNIENSQGESVGEVNDIVLDANNGRVKYLAVTYGGFLGLGDKLFAVPYEAFACHQDPDDADEHVLVLDVTQKQLEGAQGFDQDHWPNFADRTFTQDLDDRYGIDRKNLRDRALDVDVNRDGVDVDVDQTPDRN